MSDPIDYAFVPRIGQQPLPHDELRRLRAQAVRENHCAAILREALLDREHDHAALGRALAGLGDDYVFNSFPSALFAGANLVVRSEYLIMRQTGTRRLAFDDLDGFAAAACELLRPHAPRSILYRLCDYSSDDFDFLDPARAGSRGAQRLLDQPELLELDLRCVSALLAAGIPVDVLVPFVQFPWQFTRLRAAVEAHVDGGPRPGRIGMMLEVPAAVLEVARYAAADFFAFGPSDLLQCLYGGLDRDGPAFDHVNPAILIGLVRDALTAIDRLGGKQVYLAKSLIDLAEQLPLAPFTRTHVGRLYFPGQLVDAARD